MNAQFWKGFAWGAAVTLLLWSVALTFTYSEPMRQDRFACEEDELLGYHPRFGPDHVGCIHIDELRPAERGPGDQGFGR